MSGVRFDGRAVVVTGAGQGIGRACVLHLARLGAQVVVNDIGRTSDDEPTAERVVQEIRSGGGSAVACTASVAAPDGPAQIAASVLDAFGRWDVLINNAGIVRTFPVEEHTMVIWDDLCAVHLTGAFLLTQLAFR